MWLVSLKLEINKGFVYLTVIYQTPEKEESIFLKRLAYYLTKYVVNAQNIIVGDFSLDLLETHFFDKYKYSFKNLLNNLRMLQL